MQNVAAFESFFKDSDIYFDKNVMDDGVIKFSLRDQTLTDTDGHGSIFVLFDPQDAYIDIHVYFAKISNPLKREAAYELLNELNASYRYTKFKMEDGNISANYSFPDLQASLTGRDIMDMVFLTFKSATTVYPKIMKLVWG